MDARTPAIGRLAVAEGVILEDIETEVLARLRPPLNLDKVATPWRPFVRAGRKRLADQARAMAAGSVGCRHG